MASNTETKTAKAAHKTVEEAFLEMQKELPTILRVKDGFNFKYAPYEEIARIAFPVLWRHGFSICHSAQYKDGNYEVATKLVYSKDGSTMTSCLPFSPTVKDQDRGKSLTYAKRYNTVLLLGLSIDGEPDSDDNVPVTAPSNNDF